MYTREMTVSFSIFSETKKGWDRQIYPKSQTTKQIFNAPALQNGKHYHSKQDDFQKLLYVKSRFTGRLLLGSDT